MCFTNYETATPSPDFKFVDSLQEIKKLQTTKPFIWGLIAGMIITLLIAFVYISKMNWQYYIALENRIEKLEAK